MCWDVYCYVFLCFFFFQAEDGLRDRTVPGVQTCAFFFFLEVFFFFLSDGGDMSAHFRPNGAFFGFVGGCFRGVGGRKKVGTRGLGECGPLGKCFGM